MKPNIDTCSTAHHQASRDNYLSADGVTPLHIHAMSISPTQLSLRKLRADGITCQVVEYFNSHSRKRVDLFTVIDIVGLHGEDTIGIQCTTKANMKAREKKIIECEYLPALRDAGWTLLLWGWWKDGNRWVVKETDLS